MKYLILVLTSLFCLSSFSDHKKDPVSEEERNRYYELDQREFDLNKKEEKEYKKLEEKRLNESIKIWSHFNIYMDFEMKMDQALKGDLESQHDIFDLIFLNLDDDATELQLLSESLPDCKKENCPKAPYNAIYWAKKYFESGHCVWRAASRMSQLIGNYVIPKTDMEDNEDFFHILHYVSSYFSYQSKIYDSADYNKSYEAQAEMHLKIQAQKDPHFKIDPKKEACLQSEVCLSFKQQLKEKIKPYKYRELELRNALNEKQKEIAEKMISDLIQKWSKKYGKDKIYECRLETSLNNKKIKDKKTKIDFLDKKYPYY